MVTEILWREWGDAPRVEALLDERRQLLTRSRITIQAKAPLSREYHARPLREGGGLPAMRVKRGAAGSW